MRGEILLAEGLRHRRLELRGEAFHVHLPITRHANNQRMTSAVDLGDHQHDVLQRVAGLPAPVAARKPSVGQVDESLDGRSIGRVLDMSSRSIVVCQRLGGV